MQRVIVAFDVDGTLITADTDTGNDGIIGMLKVLSTFQNIRIVVWSGSGKDYAAMWVRRLGIEDFVWRVASKTEHKELKALGTLVTVDDQEITIGDVNMILGRDENVHN